MKRNTGIVTNGKIVFGGIILTLGMVYSSLAQSSKSTKTLITTADQYWKYEQYAEAAKYYRQAAATEPANIYAAHQLAECNRNLFNYAEAEAGYGKVCYENTHHYPKALFYYALMQKLNGRYARSIQSFEKFIKQLEADGVSDWPDKQHWKERAKAEKEGCSLALTKEKFSQNEYHFSLTPAPISTESNDYAPVIFQSDSSLIISSGRIRDSSASGFDTRLGEAFSDFYSFRLEGNNWQKLGQDDDFSLINTQWNEGTGCFNRAKDRFYFTGCGESDAACRIYVSTLVNGKWSAPVKLNKNINQTGSDARHPMVSVTGDTLFFVSNRSGGFGMNDIWMSITAGGDDWSPAINLGGQINTPYNDVSPFISYKDNQFFFASEGHVGLGGLDLFVIDGPLSSLSSPTNLGSPFNSSRDDAFFVMGKDKAYLSSNRLGGVGKFDIYSMNIYSSEVILANMDQKMLKDRPDLAYLNEYNLEYLPEEQKIIADRIIHRKKAGWVYNQDIPLMREDISFYESLSPAEKGRLEKIVTSNVGQLSVEEIKTIKQEDNINYWKLPLQEKARIERLTDTYQQAIATRQTPEWNKEDQFYYEQLATEEKRMLDRLVASRMQPTQEATDSSTVEEEPFNYENLPQAEKDRLDRMAAARYVAEFFNTPVEFAEEDQFFYQNLPAEERNRLNRLLSARIVQQELAKDESSFEDDTEFNYDKVPIEENEQIRSKSAPRNSRHLVMDETNSTSINLDRSTTELNTFSLGRYKTYTIQGKLFKTQNNQPAEGVKIILVDEQGEELKATVTNPDGTFSYKNLSVAGDCRIQVETASSKLTEGSIYYVENLELTGYYTEAVTLQYEQVYFAIDQYSLSTDALRILDALIIYYRQHPQVQIELSAYTDNTGADDYNLKLSQKRGAAVQQYLLDHGIPPNAMVVNAMGKRSLNTEKLTEQRDRCVEFVIKGLEAQPLESTEIYIISPQTSLRAIADKFNVTVEELRRGNELVGDQVEPYRPIKIKRKTIE